jgi:bifunctional non-homologous end joining protein LigD
VIAFDLDPGEVTGSLECCEVALRRRALFASLEPRSFAKISGAKGLQVYVPLNSDVSYAEMKPVSRAIAELLEAERPDAVVSRMARNSGPGRSSWTGASTRSTSRWCARTPSARKRRPTVSTPLKWRSWGTR